MHGMDGTAYMDWAFVPQTNNISQRSGDLETWKPGKPGETWGQTGYSPRPQARHPDSEGERLLGYQARVYERMAFATMKILERAALLSICIAVSLLGTKFARAKEASMVDDFVLNPSKPYVYLVLDHVGPRKPLRDGEANKGVWLRLVNNCRLPLVIIASKASANVADGAFWVQDEVVPNKPSPGTESEGAGVGYEPGQEDLTEIFLHPNEGEAEVRGAEKAARSSREVTKRPHGYNDGYQPGPQVLKVIPPGGEVLFSLPINHVSKTWHFEVPFRFALKQEGTIRQPYSYVAFFWDDLPDVYRSGASLATQRCK